MAGVRWVRLDTSYLMNPKIVSIDRDALLIHLASMTWCADQLTDGHIPVGALPTLAAMARVRTKATGRAVEQLVVVGLWQLNGTGWYLHDFDVMNPQATRFEVERQRTKWAKKKADWRAAQQSKDAQEHDG